MSGKYALIIGNTEYTDPGLAKLTAPGKDAEDFAQILRDRDLCGFDEVKILVNQVSSSVIEAIDEFFDLRKPDDLLLLYYSGHGMRDELGSLYLAFKNTIRSRLRSTAIKSEYIREVMDQSRSKRQVLILDCCNSGAFPQGAKAEAGGPMGMMAALQGYGRYVLTASDSTQFAWEGDRLIGKTQNSLFTHFLIKGLEGEADRDGDGTITVDELYDYAFDEICKVTPKQTPTKSASKQEGEIILRQITRMEHIRAVALPEELIEATEDSRTFVREGAVQQLGKLLQGKNLGLARSARTALEKMAAEDDSLRVRQTATQALLPVREAEQRAEQERKANEAAQRQAALNAEQERLEAERVEQDRLARESAEADRRAKEKAERSIARQKVEAGAKLEAERIAEEKRLTTEKAEAQRRAARKVARPSALERSETPLGRGSEVAVGEGKTAGLPWRALGIGAFVVAALGLGAWLIFSSWPGRSNSQQPPPVNSNPTMGQAPAAAGAAAWTASDCPRPDVFCIGFVADVGTINDKGFNQSAWEGVQKAKVDGVADWVQYIETTDPKDYDKNIATFAEAGYDVIVTWGFNLTDATYNAAKKYPNVKFIGGDQFLSKDTNHPDWPLANLVSISYHEDQSGFLVGALGAMMSQSHKIGAVCASDAVPPVWRYGEGYRAGAAYEDKKNNTTTEVTVVYHSDAGFDKTFTDPTWGAATANSMIDKGVDVVFACGGKTGNGAVDAAAQRGVYAIGVDTDQYFTLPEAASRLLSSAMKPETDIVAAVIKLTKEGQFPTGGLFMGPPGYAPYHDLASQVPAKVAAEMPALLRGLTDGSIQTGVPAVKPGP